MTAAHYNNRVTFIALLPRVRGYHRLSGRSANGPRVLYIPHVCCLPVLSVLVSFVCISHRGTSIDNIEVIVEHPNGNPPHIETLTTEKKQHLVKADLGEGGFTYRVCFQSKQAKGQRTRVEVRDKEGITLLPPPCLSTTICLFNPWLLASSHHFAVTPIHEAFAWSDCCLIVVLAYIRGDCLASSCVGF